MDKLPQALTWLIFEAKYIGIDIDYIYIYIYIYISTQCIIFNVYLRKDAEIEYYNKNL